MLNAKGAPLKPPQLPTSAAALGQQQQQPLLPPSSPNGAFLEVQEQGLGAGLPLNPGASLSLPVKVLVGKPPANSFDSSTVQVSMEACSMLCAQRFTLVCGVQSHTCVS